MALPVSPQPPTNETPMSGDGQHTQAWSQYHQKMSDALSGVKTGTTTNDNAAVGSIGEYVSGTGTGVTLTNGTAANVASITLTAGDWDVTGNMTFTPAPTTHPAALGASCSSTSGAFGAQATLIQTAFAIGGPNSFDAGGVTRFSLASTTTVYLVGVAFFTTAGMSAGGFLAGRRAR
jgi:hypothetical protein